MRDPSHEELISAYLDGELSSEERLFVEEQLKTSDDFRGLFDQFQKQQAALRSLPPWRLSADFNARLERRLQAARTDSPQPAQPAPRRITLAHSRRWKVLISVASSVAAALLVAAVVYLTRPSDVAITDPPLKVPNELIAQKAHAEPEKGLAEKDASPKVGPRTDGPAIAEIKSDVAQPPEQPLPADTLLAEFRQMFRLLIIYDVAVTPEGRANGAVDKCLEAAGIDLMTNVPIDRRLERGLLESRFIGNDRIVVDGESKKTKDVSGDEVEMVFVRGTSGQIERFWIECKRAQVEAKRVIYPRMDMAVTDKEFEIFMNLNQAIAQRTSRPQRIDEWKTPGAYRLTFESGLRSDSSTPVEAAPPVDGSSELDENRQGANDPGQLLLIIRNLREAPK